MVSHGDMDETLQKKLLSQKSEGGEVVNGAGDMRRRTGTGHRRVK